MQLYPTSALTKRAAKVLKNEVKVQLTADLAAFLNDEFTKANAKFADKGHLNALVGSYYQAKSAQFLESSAADKN